MIPFFLCAFVGVLVLEALVTFAKPRLFSPLARFRIGEPPRSVYLPPAAIAALTLETDAEGGYREAPERHLDLARLRGDPIVAGETYVLTFLPERAEFMARKPFDMSRKPRPTVFVRLRAEGERILLDARYYPSQLGVLVSFLVFSVVVSRSLIPVIPFGLFFLIPYLMDRAAARTLLDAVEAEVAARVRLLTAQAVRLPITSDSGTMNRLDADEGAEAPPLERSDTAVGTRGHR